MNKASELKSAAARLEAIRQLDLQKAADAARRAEQNEEREIEALKTARLRELRLAREAALREAACRASTLQIKKRSRDVMRQPIDNKR